MWKSAKEDTEDILVEVRNDILWATGGDEEKAVMLTGWIDEIIGKYGKVVPKRYARLTAEKWRVLDIYDKIIGQFGFTVEGEVEKEKREPWRIR